MDRSIMNSEPNAWIFLNHVRELGPMRFHEMLQHVGSATQMLTMQAKDFVALGAAEGMAQYWVEQIHDARIQKAFDVEMEKIEKGEFRAICELDPQYPPSLKELADRPPVLYVKGIWPSPLGFSLGIVGTRQLTPYGQCVAERFTIDLVHKGVQTVSGLASGIDTIVHQMTLREQGYTVAVLGHGFKYQFPRQNSALFGIIAEKGTLITEFPFEAIPDARHFPRRNRIISGLSRGVLVVEAGEKSGARITARYAAEQGRDVFVTPGSIYSPQSRGCHTLIKEGATLVESAEDILAAYGYKNQEPTRTLDVTSESQSPLSSVEKKLLELVSCIPVSADELAEMSGMPISRMADVLLSLELKGKIKGMPGQRYVTYN